MKHQPKKQLIDHHQWAKYAHRTDRSTRQKTALQTTIFDRQAELTELKLLSFQHQSLLIDAKDSNL